jgi:molybdopterin-guanine dinucleotide biosynthesis protein A
VARRRLTGVLLVGGASRRFGSPKALARFEGETLAERGWRVLGDACDERIAVGKTADELPLPFPVLDDDSDVRAPIAGVVAGLRVATNELCVVLPVDCPLISAESLLRLAGAAAPAAVSPTGPLPGAYRRMLLPLLEEKLSRGDYSLRNVEAAVVDIDSRELANVNTQADLATLMAVSSLALRDRT